jgi:hypothetical protein
MLERLKVNWYLRVKIQLTIPDQQAIVSLIQSNRGCRRASETTRKTSFINKKRSADMYS